jgi:hypothetical protein
MLIIVIQTLSYSCSWFAYNRKACLVWKFNILFSRRGAENAGGIFFKTNIGLFVFLCALCAYASVYIYKLFIWPNLNVTVNQYRKGQGIHRVL